MSSATYVVMSAENRGARQQRSEERNRRRRSHEGSALMPKENPVCAPSHGRAAATEKLTKARVSRRWRSGEGVADATGPQNRAS